VRSGLVTALDRDTGERVWEVDLESPIYASPVVGDGTVYIGSGASMLFAIDALTGEMRWASPTLDWVIAPAAYSGDTVIVASQGKMVDIFDTKNGRHRLKYDTGKVRFGGAPAIQGDLAYFSSDGGLIWAIDRESQTFPLERFIFRVKLNLYVWQLISGRPIQLGGIWSKRIGGNINLPLAITEDAVFGVKGNGTVFSRELKTGKEIWSTGVDGNVGVAPTVAGQTLLIGDENGNVTGIDISSGKILWEFPIGVEITSSPIVAGDAIYVGAADGKLYAITGQDG
jgi:outer membrane protein assembly factor BamB